MIGHITTSESSGGIKGGRPFGQGVANAVGEFQTGIIAYIPFVLGTDGFGLLIVIGIINFRPLPISIPLLLCQRAGIFLILVVIFRSDGKGGV